jgi:hypothetical protein
VSQRCCRRAVSGAVTRRGRREYASGGGVVYRRCAVAASPGGSVVVATSRAVGRETSRGPSSAARARETTESRTRRWPEMRAKCIVDAPIQGTPSGFIV